MRSTRRCQEEERDRTSVSSGRCNLAAANRYRTASDGRRAQSTEYGPLIDLSRTLRWYKVGVAMGNVKSIERAVEALPPAELPEFRRWFAEYDAAAWDSQIDHDAASDELDRLADEALTDYRSGPSREP